LKLPSFELPARVIAVIDRFISFC